MNMRSHRAYATTQRETAVSSARPIDLVVMVYERLLDHLRSAQLQMSEGADASESLTKAIDLIVTGLDACLDKHQGGEIAENLAAIYSWSSREIMQVRIRRDPSKLQGVINAMLPLAEAWRQHAAMSQDTSIGVNQSSGTAALTQSRFFSTAMAA